MNLVNSSLLLIPYTEIRQNRQIVQSSGGGVFFFGLAAGEVSALIFVQLAGEGCRNDGRGEWEIGAEQDIAGSCEGLETWKSCRTR